jgi:hypothetical protein
MKAYREVEVQFHAFLTKALDADEWSASSPAASSQGKGPWYPFDRRLSGPQIQNSNGRIWYLCVLLTGLRISTAVSNIMTSHLI